MSNYGASSQTDSTGGNKESAPKKTAITVAHGDGIGPEIMEATLFLLEQAEADLDIHTIEIGESLYKSGISSGIAPESWNTLRDTGVLLKAPITTPRGKGYKSLNVTIRKTLGLYANVRPCPTYHPFITTHHPKMDVVIIRENEEDTYGGIEHRQTSEVTQCLKLISRPGCEKVIRYAFEYAKANGRKKITCLVKDNIMKITDGLFHTVFDEISAHYPGIETETQIIDIGTARLANQPDLYDVIVLPNLYGDIVSDVAAEITGSVGLAGSANVGDKFAMFEAIHGSAPDIAGRGIANPSGLIHGAIMMMDHLGQPKVAEVLHNAWLRTIEDGVLTADICQPDKRSKAAGTDAFAHAMANRLGMAPRVLPTPSYVGEGHREILPYVPAKAPLKELVGVDVFLDWDEDNRNPETLGKQLEAAAGPEMKLKMITNRGSKVYPEGHPETFCTDHWRCRFVGNENQVLAHQAVIGLLNSIAEAKLDFIKTEHLYKFDGELGYSLGQGE